LLHKSGVFSEVSLQHLAPLGLRFLMISRPSCAMGPAQPGFCQTSRGDCRFRLLHVVDGSVQN